MGVHCQSTPLLFLAFALFDRGMPTFPPRTWPSLCVCAPKLTSSYHLYASHTIAQRSIVLSIPSISARSAM